MNERVLATWQRGGFLYGVKLDWYQCERDHGLAPQEVARRLAEWTQKNPQPAGTIAAVADHVDHIRKVAGIDHVGIGADFYDDGRDSMAAGLENVTRYPHLFAELLRRGYGDEDLKKIAGRNLLRAMRGMERVAKELQSR